MHLKGWHISRTYPVVASPHALSNIVIIHPLFNPYYRLPHTTSLSLSYSLSGALTVAGVKREGFVRDNRRSVDPPATDYPPS